MCHSPIAPPVMCPVPGAPSNGSMNISNTQTYIEGSEVNYQCNDKEQCGSDNIHSEKIEILMYASLNINI